MKIKNLLNKYTIPIIVILAIGLVIYLLKKKENLVSRLGKELVFFSMDGCQHCENMRPVYELLRKNYGGNQYIEIKEVKSSERPEIIKRHQIRAFPTIAYLKNGNLKNKNEGKMDYEDLVRFMNYSISN
jgi:thiol-disulfide isomerase/thioredoxin